ADAVVGVAPVEPRALPTIGLQLLEPLVRPLPQLVQGPELDRVRRTGLRASRLVPALEPVVAERALPDAPVLLLRDDWKRGWVSPRQMPFVEDAERTRGHAVAAAVADVLLHDDGPVLRPEERPGRAHVEARGMRAVLADIRAHEPAQRVLVALLDERDVPPRVRAELRGVVVGLARPDHSVLGHEVPLLACDLAGLAADADRRVGEEADAVFRLRPVAIEHAGGVPA